MTTTSRVRLLTAADVEFRLVVEREHVPVEGNVLASGDEAEDRAYEESILGRLRKGDTWAWAAVTVEARWRDYVGRDHLGCCTYADEGEFRAPDGYYPQMCEEALAELNRVVQDAAADLAELAL